MGFLSSFFTAPPDAFTDSETISLDIIRSGEEIAPVVQSLDTGAVTLVEDKFVNKEIPFPVYALDSPVGASQLMARQPGETAIITERVNWLGRLARILVPKFAIMTAMIRRSIELQAAQILQTGTITLTDENGIQTYILDLKAKASHFPTAAIPWGTTDYDPIKDIDALADVVRNDGQCDVVNVIFGDWSWDKFIKNGWVQENLKQDNLNLGALDPQIVGKGAKRMGFINSGSNRYDLYIYSGRYNPWKSTVVKKYLAGNKVILLPHTSDLDFRRYFGGIPTVISNPISEEIFGGTIPVEGEYNFRPRIYPDEKLNVWTGEIKSRPLCLPVSIDRFGCLTTGPDA
jgi:hypothetical protein